MSAADSLSKFSSQTKPSVDIQILLAFIEQIRHGYWLLDPKNRPCFSLNPAWYLKLKYIDCIFSTRYVCTTLVPMPSCHKIANSESRILALSSHSVVSCPSFVRAQKRDILPFVHNMTFLDHTNQIFSESIWHPLSTDPPTTRPWPFMTHQTHPIDHLSTR